ncbi:MAG: bifunctional glutamate N-acetyltransferase/amino-acid acetyltransferase ArgJ [Gammaproteobacteria bacterium]|nr:bifunctional glutamate N-acetyltransferase/amino-acid acetyltransferase ArgJ [Gammaproteobacteria bacterium]
MPVNLKPAEGLLPVPGVRLGVAQAGVKYPSRDDLLVIEVPAGSTAAAVFTRNAFCAAPVTVARRHLATTATRYLLVNSGNANAGNGPGGLEDALRTCRALAEAGGVCPEAVLPFSTGVIGAPLPVDRMVAAVPAALSALTEDGWLRAARAIMTTDTVPKGLSARRTVGGHAFTVTGIAKGAGMIRPDMATMLAFLATDAAVPEAVLQTCLLQAVGRSFNRITVDGDTSTNDACVLLATGRSSAPPVGAVDGEVYVAFRDAVEEVCSHLARAIVRDAEGATKFVTVAVEGGASEAECLDVAHAIAHSPLVKTALFASDPNWGRILAAVGRAGLRDLDIGRVRIDLGDVTVVEAGGRAAGYTEAQGQAVLAAPEITLRVSLGRGDAAVTVWTCDLSYDYVRINAEYRT